MTKTTTDPIWIMLVDDSTLVCRGSRAVLAAHACEVSTKVVAEAATASIIGPAGRVSSGLSSKSVPNPALALT